MKKLIHISKTRYLELAIGAAALLIVVVAAQPQL